MKFTLITVAMLGLTLSSTAQVYNNGDLYNNGGLISDWSMQYISTSSGNYSTVGATGGPAGFAVFEHRGQSGSGAAAAMVNDGVYEAGNFGRDYFIGPNAMPGQQEISGTQMPIFGALFIQNGPASVFNITNSGGIGVLVSATFENAITTTIRSNTYAGSLKFAPDATYIGANTDGQHIDGYVSKAGTEAFVFPVGDGLQLRSLEIDAPTVTTDISVAWFTGDPSSVTDPSDGTVHNTANVAAPITSVSPAGFWDWIVESGTFTGNVTVSLPDLSATAAPASDLRLVGWDGTQWIALGTTGASGVAAGSTLSGTVQAGITAIGIGSVGAPLPVLFSGFEAARKGCTALLSWSTAMEKDNDHFEVERSIDGRDFQVIATVRAAGNSSGERQYQFEDAHPANGKNYYRITQVDLDGKRSSTVVKSLHFDCSASAIKVYPTVIKDQLFVSLPAGFENAKLRVYTTLGRELELPNTGNAGRSGLHSIPFRGLAPGQYLLRVTAGSTTQTFKVIYQP